MNDFIGFDDKTSILRNNLHERPFLYVSNEQTF
jgi:hypothetical protein